MPAAIRSGPPPSPYTPDGQERHQPGVSAVEKQVAKIVGGRRLCVGTRVQLVDRSARGTKYKPGITGDPPHQSEVERQHRQGPSHGPDPFPTKCVNR